MGEKSDSPEEKRTLFGLPVYGNEPKVDYDYADLLNELPTEEERPAMDAWKEQNAELLSKMSRRKRQKTFFAALDELRLQRAREQVEEATKPSAGDMES